MECKNGVNKVSFLPLMTIFTKVVVVASLSSNPTKNTKNQPLEPQLLREGETLGACVQ